MNIFLFKKNYSFQNNQEQQVGSASIVIKDADPFALGFFDVVLFDKKNEKALIVLNPLLNVTYFVGVNTLSNAIGSVVGLPLSDKQFLSQSIITIQYLNLFYCMPTIFYNIDIPYFYDDYPFKTINGILSRNKNNEKLWLGNISFLSNFKNNFLDNYYIENKLFFEKNIVSINQKKYNLIQDLNISYSYQFARNDFFIFQSGFGYSHFSDHQDGVQFNYGIDFFYQPVHVNFNWNTTTNLQKTIQANCIWGIGYHFNNIEVKGVYLNSKTNELQLSQLLFGMSIWY